MERPGLEVADIFRANGVAFAKGRPLELSRTDFGDIVGQARAHRFLQADFLQHRVCFL